MFKHKSQPQDDKTKKEPNTSFEKNENAAKRSNSSSWKGPVTMNALRFKVIEEESDSSTSSMQTSENLSDYKP